MSNFYEFLYGKRPNTAFEKVVEDAAPKKKSLTGGYFVFCNDRDGTLKNLIEAIGKHGNCGHTYDIVLDPDSSDGKESFCWDGDGSDRIKSIIAIPEDNGDDNPLIRMCLQTLNSINRQARDATREEDELTSIEKDQILKNIEHDSDLLLEGAKFEDNAKRNLGSIKCYCDNCLAGLQKTSPFYDDHKSLTVEEVLEHIKGIAEEGLKKGVTFLA